MTREEAVHIWERRHYDLAEGMYSMDLARRDVDAMIKLGILKVEEPKTAIERALHAINYAIDAKRNRFEDAEHLISVLACAGVRIVDK